MPEYTACYIDDEAADAERQIQRLNAIGSFQTHYLAPTKDLSLDTLPANPQLFFVDWELDTRQDKIGEQVYYKGGTFAAKLREKFENLPIVLVTREGILDDRLLQRYVNSLFFDAYIPKRLINAQPEFVAEECLQLITGFHTLNQIRRDWQGILEALRAQDDEKEMLGESAPPLFKEGGATAWSTPEIAKWIRNVLLKYPGILYDSLYSATFLGIDESEMKTQDVQNVLQRAVYSGVFSPPQGRWWKNRLMDIAQEVIAQAGLRGSSINKNFSPAFAKVHGRELRPSVCVYSGKTPADWVCYILNKPVLIEYSLPYHPDTRPAVMEDARVSFKAIRESNNVFDEYFDPSSRQLLEEIRGWEQNEI